MEDDLPLAETSALGALERRPATVLRWIVCAVIWLRGRESAAPEAAHALVIRRARELGFRYVGEKREGLTPIGILSDVWIAPDESAYLTGLQARSRDPFVRGLSRYSIHTYCDDGTSIATLADKDAIVDDGVGIVHVRGTDSLVNDWAAHRAAVAAHCTSRGCRVIRVSDLATVLRLVRFHFRQLVSVSSAKLIVGMFVVMASLFFALLALLLRWVRF